MGLSFLCFSLLSSFRPLATALGAKPTVAVTSGVPEEVVAATLPLKTLCTTTMVVRPLTATLSRAMVVPTRRMTVAFTTNQRCSQTEVALLLMAPAPAVDTSTSSHKKTTTTKKMKTKAKKKKTKTTTMRTMMTMMTMTKTTMKMKIRTNRFFTELAESLFIFFECGSLINVTFNCGIICLYLFV